MEVLFISKKDKEPNIKEASVTMKGTARAYASGVVERELKVREKPKKLFIILAFIILIVDSAVTNILASKQDFLNNNYLVFLIDTLLNICTFGLGISSIVGYVRIKK